MYCKNCGNEIDENVNFCPDCGYKIDGKTEDSNKKIKTKTDIEKNEVEGWEPCPRCESTNVKKINKKAILIAMWTGSIVFMIFPIIGIPALGITLVATIASFFVKTTVLKCENCNKTWKYPANKHKNQKG